MLSTGRTSRTGIEPPSKPRWRDSERLMHLVQLIRDESHRFAVGYHRQRRAMRDRDSELLQIPGVGPLTRQRLLTQSMLVT